MKDIFDLKDQSDIPVELKKELSCHKVNTFESEILALFKVAGRPISIDEIMIAYYRKYKKLKKGRNAFVAKLYNMAGRKDSQIIACKGKKGVYSMRF